MATRHVSQTYKKFVLHTDREGLITFLERIRGLETEAREAYISERTKYERDRVERVEQQARAKKWEPTVLQELEKDSARLDYESKLKEITDSVEMTATFSLSDSVTETEKASPREIVENNSFSKAQRIHIRPSGNFNGPIQIRIDRDSGITVELSTGDMGLYERARDSIPVWLGRISVPLHRVFRPAVSFFLAISLLGVALLSWGSPDSKFLSNAIWVLVAIFVVHWTARAWWFPQIHVKEEPNSGMRVMKWIGGTAVALVVGIAGSYLYELIFKN